MNLKKMTALAMSVLTVMSNMQVTTFAFNPSIQVFSDESSIKSQTKSAPELIYPNEYGLGKRTQNFDKNWKFYLGNIEAASEKNFNDSSWRELNLPHDYSIEQEYRQNLEAESGYLPGGTAWYRKKFILPSDAQNKRVRIDFGGIYMNATIYVNGHKLGIHHYGYTPFSFDITKYLDFNSENVIAVKVEHKTPSSRWYSGSGIYRSVNLTITNPIHIDLWGTKITTPDLNTNTTNPKVVVKTKIKNDTEQSSENITVINTIYDESNSSLATISSESFSLDNLQTKEISLEMNIANPILWTLDNPKLYKVKTEIKVGEEVVDSYDTPFGFRYFNFDKNRGFSLNGTNMKLKGVCMHHDQGALGAIANKTAIKRQVEILKEMGCNSIRVTHNPAASELLEVCDELGMLVIDEAFDGWHKKKNGNTQDYSLYFNKTIDVDNQILTKTDNMKWYEFDLSAMINSGYNSPSVIMWSMGNEVLEGVTDGNDRYEEVARNLANLANSLDESRPSTIGDNKIKGETNNPNNLYARIDQNIANVGGVVGLNYANGSQYDAWHNLKPDWKLYASETVSSINSRGIYKISGYQNGQNASKQLTAYDKSKVGWGAFASEGWLETIKRDYLAGEYVWTGFDYLGEPTPYNGIGQGAVGSWPSPKSSYFGIVDTAGLPKDSYYLYRSLWNDKNTTLHILPAWNENVVEKDRNNKVSVVVYSNAKSVKLFFKPNNGQEQDLGLKKFTTKNSNNSLYQYQIYEGNDKSQTQHENLYLTWKVPYQDGTLRAEAYSDENGTNLISDTIGRNIVKTTKAAKKIVLKQYRDDKDVKADAKDLAYVEVNVVDEDGNIIPDASNDISFEIEGEGKLVGLDNGNPVDHTSYKANHRRVFSGKAIAIIQATETAGSFTLRASSQGLEPASITIETKVEENNDSEDISIKSYLMSKNYYVKKGSYPILPEKIQVNYNNDTSSEESVVWETLTENQINKVANFEVKGSLESGKNVFVNINVIDKVAALLNYSTSTPVGSKAILPSSRPAVLSDGEVLKVDFPVSWEEIDENRYNEAGIIKVNGRAEVFGEILNVEASIRVQNENITIGNSVSGQVLRLTQDIGGAATSDTLDAIKDGLKEANANQAGGPNSSLWSNWNAAQSGKTSASLTFEYATQQRLGEVDIYFAKDTGSLRYPDEGTTELYVSEDANNWTKLVTTEEIADNEISNNVKKYTYRFSPKTCTFIKIVVKNSTNDAGMSRRPSIGITEVELKTATGSYDTYRTTDIESLELNGINYNTDVLRLGYVSTKALFVDSISIRGKDNAATTFINNAAGTKKAHIIIESEDHSKRRVFEIKLDEENENESPEDSSRDYPIEDMTLRAGNEEPRANNVVNSAKDGQSNTLWHTLWNKFTPLDERWISIELEEETKIDGFRYLSRSGESNGRVNEYKILVSTDNISWKEVDSGTWKNESGWKLASFNKVNAKYVKLQGISTYGEGSQANKFMSAAEVRVKVADETIDISDESSDIRVNLEQTKYIVEELKEPVKVNLSVTSGANELKYGIDYRIKYENNNRIGTAYAIVEGILKYSGKIKVPFKILSKAAREVFVEDANIIAIDGEEVLLENASLEKDTQVSIKAREKDGMDFSHWRVMPKGLELENVENPDLSFTMPDHSIRFVAVYTKDGKNIEDVYTNSSPDTWYANADKEDLKAILDTLIEDVEEASLRLDLNKRDRNILRATNSDATEDMEKSFFIDAKLVKENIETDGANTRTVETVIEDTKTLRVSVEVPKKDRNMADYKVISYRKVDNEVIIDVVDSIEKDGFISFILSTDTVYGIFYKKAYEIVFEDYDGRVLSRQNVEIGQMPEVPEVETRDGYVFVGWNKDISEVKENRTYKAVYEISTEQLDISKERLRAETSRARQEIYGKEDLYTSDSLKALEKELVKAEILVEESFSLVKIENQIQLIRKALSKLKTKSINIITKTNSSSSGKSGGVVKVAQTRKDKQVNKYINVLESTWKNNGSKWQLFNNNKLVKNKWAYKDIINNRKWYMLDSNGDMRVGWFKTDSGKWYFFDTDKNENEGIMQTGWRWIKSEDSKMRCYYFSEKNETVGILLVDTIIDGKYTVDKDGAWTVDGVVQTK